MSFFKYNNFTGRLSSASQSASYMPAGFQPTAAEPKPFQFDTTATRPAVAPAVGAQPASVSAASGSGKGVVPVETGYKSVRGLQSRMTIEDGLMVWQKRGATDKFPAWATFGIVAITTVYGLSLVLKMSFPPKNE